MVMLLEALSLIGRKVKLDTEFDKPFKASSSHICHDAGMLWRIAGSNAGAEVPTTCHGLHNHASSNVA